MIDELEFHDSTLLSVTAEGADTVLELDAYVHRTIERDGREVDTGWEQKLQIVVANGEVRRELPESLGDWREIWDGTVRIGSKEYLNLVPLDLEATGPAEGELEIGNGLLVVAGRGIRIERAGEPGYVEDVPCHRR